ncbi:MAG: sigma-70 family RNA polymerase sigma factor [Thermoleophilaceae bacterium]
MDTAELWTRRRAGDAQARAALIERYAPLAAIAARRLNVPTGAVAGRDDLESAGLLGLVDAVDRYETERGIPFEPYAMVRIRGAMLDEVRRLDERGKAGRRHDRAAAGAWGGAAGQLSAALSLDQLLEAGGALPETNDDVGAHYELEELRTRVEHALRELPARQRELIVRYYGESLTLREAGERMGISEARASQLHGRAIHNLRRRLAGRTPRTGPAAA